MDYAPIICNMVDGITRDCTTFEEILAGYVQLIDQLTQELLAIKQDLTARIDKKFAMLAGTGTGVALGGGVTTIFGAAGAFVVAELSFHPF
jgi:hypothetical protein